MMYFFITFGIFAVVFIGMSIGYLIKRKTISGSCGGLGSVGIEKECDCPEPCDDRKAKMAAAAAEAERQKKYNQDRLL